MKKTAKKSIQIFSQLAEKQSVRVVIFFLSLFFLILVWSFRHAFFMLSSYGYIGIFLINFFASATMLVPLPGIASVFFAGSIWNPFFVGFFSGVGAACGELIGYFTGFGGRVFVKKHEKTEQWFFLLERFFQKRGFFAIFIAACIPTPLFDVFGFIAGALSYPLWKFFLATLMGRILRNMFLAFIGGKILPG